MDVYATITVEDSEVIEEIFAQGQGAILQIGYEWYPVLSVDTETGEVEVGNPDEITYH